MKLRGNSKIMQIRSGLRTTRFVLPKIKVRAGSNCQCPLDQEKWVNMKREQKAAQIERMKALMVVKTNRLEATKAKAKTQEAEIGELGVKIAGMEKELESIK